MSIIQYRFAVVLLISSLFPVTLGRFGPIDHFLLIEGLAPVGLLFGFFHLASYKRRIVPYGSTVIISAILVLNTWALYHYILNPTSSQVFGASGHGGGIRLYYRILIGTFTFFYFLWFSSYVAKEKEIWHQVLVYIFWISLLIGYARLTCHFLGIEMPFMGGTYFKVRESFINVAGRANRIGGLTEASTLGLSAWIALHYRKRWSFKFLVFGGFFLFLMIMSGGRSANIGVLATFVGYLFFVEKREVEKTAIFLLIALGIFFLGQEFGLLESQLGRLTAIKGGLAANSPGRYALFKEMWEIFLRHPMMGKGIGCQYVDKNLPRFIIDNLNSGGHGSYLSILMLFGLGGAFFLIMTLFGTLLRSYSYLTKNECIGKTDDKCIMICFILVVFSIMTFTFLVEGGGYNRLRLYVLSGIATGILAAK